MIGSRIPTADSPMPKIIFATPFKSFLKEVFEGVDLVFSDWLFLLNFDNFLCKEVSGDDPVPWVSSNGKGVV